MQKALTQMHITLQHVVSDVTGETGMAIMRAITVDQTAGRDAETPKADSAQRIGERDEDTIPAKFMG
jgi:hypothetical protein